MTEPNSPPFLSPAGFPRLLLQSRLVRWQDAERPLNGDMRALSLLMCNETDRTGAVRSLHVADVMLCCDVSERTARRIVARLEATGLCTWERAGRRGYRIAWRLEHPLLASVVRLSLERVRRTAAAASRGLGATAAAPASPPPPPVELITVEERAMVETIQRAHAVAAGTPTLDRALRPDTARALAQWLAGECERHGLEPAEAARVAARAFRSDEGRAGRLRDAGWPLALWSTDLPRLTEAIARHARRQGATREGPQVAKADPELSRRYPGRPNFAAGDES